VTQVVLMTHAGVPCALPADQVVGGFGADVPAIALFGAPEPDPKRALVVKTPGGARRVDCSVARFSNLDERSLSPVPELLAQRLELPHVVGVAGTGTQLRWLVDLVRWEER